MHGWIGKASREIDTTPVLHFRKALQSVGLLRKREGTLRLTRAGRNAQADSRDLWNRLAERLIPTTDGFDADATTLLLAWAATSTDAELPLDMIAAALNHLGWQRDDGSPIVDYHLYWLPAVDVLRNLSRADSRLGQRWQISAEAAELARAALQTR